MRKVMFGMAVCLMSMMGTNAHSSSFTIDDTYGSSAQYWGGEYYKGVTYKTNGDVIGDARYFGVNSMTVNTSSNKMAFTVNSPFFSALTSTDVAVKANLLGVTMGDLFLSNDGWSPYSAGINYQYDHYLNGTDWEYALVFDDHSGTSSSGVISLYSVVEDRILLSNQVLDTASVNVRWGQEVRYNTNAVDSLMSGSWSIVGDLLSITIDWPSSSTLGSGFESLGLVDNIGFRWTMTCANDVIEGGDPVPEPATMVLFGLGLAGLGGLRLRKRA